MNKQVAIAVIHGMGSQTTDFAEPMIEEINDRIDGHSKDPDKIAWQTIYWADILKPRQDKYFRDAKRTGDLDYRKIREFVISAVGDAAAYRRVRGTSSDTYNTIHARVAENIKELYEVGLGSTPKPLIVIAHSLGGHIMSNYVWDRQHPASNPPGNLSPFERMQRLAGMITFGCNIPLFTFAYRNIVPITFPAPRLTPAIKAKARWFNFYDPDDVLGYPLRPINAAYRNVVNRDIAINVGGLFSSWNPLSHGEYWTDNDFTKPVARFISTFL